MTGAVSLRATAAATAVAATLLVAGCGGDDEPTASVAATATTAGPPAAATTTSGAGKRTGKTSTTGTSPTTKQGSSKTKTTTRKTSSGTATTSKAPSTKSSKSKKKAAPVRTVPIPPARAKLGKPQTFSGDGDKTLGTITLKRSAVVRWTASGASFALVDGAKRVSISGNAKSGQTFIAAGDYTSVKVTAKGHWTLSLTQLGN